MESNAERAKAVYAEFLGQLEAGESVTIEALAAEQPELRSELLELHAAHAELIGLLGDGKLTLEYGHELLEELGAGGSGRVFRGRDKVLGRDVAIKILADASSSSSELRQLFIEEAQAMASIRHENVIQIHSVEEVDGTIRLVMELIEGRTFERIVSQDGPLSATEAARVGTDLCRALGALHGRGLVHLDLKPSNVMRETGGRTVLLDFGLASSPDLKNVRLGGTPPFMAPEQFGRGEPGPPSDVYGLGATLYSLTSGRFPVEGDSVKEIAMQVLEGQVDPLTNLAPGLPGSFVSIVEKAMSCAPEDRYESAGHMERALREFVAGNASAEVVPVARRSGWGLLAGVLGILVLLGVLAPTLFGEDDLDVQATIMLISDGVESPLTADSTVNVDDELYLTAKGNEPFYLYVFNEDDKGNRYTLYPRVQELLPADIELRLPTENSQWQVDSAGGVEHIFVIASRKADPFGEGMKQRIQLVQEKKVSTDRGLSTEVPSTSKDDLANSLVQEFEKYQERASGSAGTLLMHWTISHSE